MQDFKELISYRKARTMIRNRKHILDGNFEILNEICNNERIILGRKASFP